MSSHLPTPDRTAERALDAARPLLLDSGNPAFVAVAVPHEGRPVLAPMVVANAPAATRGATVLGDQVPGSTVVVVGCARQGSHLRFTVRDTRGDALRLDRLEERERPIGEMPLV
ncbi:hypothetical protein [Conexibacter sp. SYSU D00693]|uniref:hypothetical protein n=1 Tax=Conexibacter sp. SYSU D00693 TaxID=2812560 RepID=UPI00196A7305|nr:hypothetical protein [Conexibacter sp. SYSU D00693]